jgi:putative FmdB family regulatory protein
MIGYIYYCGNCDKTFEVQVDENDVPTTQPCPHCDGGVGLKAFSVAAATTAAECKPGGSC